jgi:hypothetical protein
MPTSGIEIGRMFDQKVDKAYSSYLDNTKKNRLLKDAFVEAVEKKVSGNDTQMELDELNVLTKTEQPFSLVNGEIAQSSIPLYLHLKAMRIQTKEFVGDISGLGDDYIELSKQSNLSTRENILISGVTVPTSANGEFYVKKVGVAKYRVYTDAALTAPVSFGALYYGGGKVERLMWREGKNLYEDTKISIFSTPTPVFPKYEQAEQKFKIKPSDSLRISVDYYTVPPQFIDVTSSFDYETLYTLSMIKFLVNTAVYLFNLEVRDLPQYNATLGEVIQNP